MEIEEVITYHIPKQDDVSPISVFIINHDKGNFEVTITHRGCAWTARLFTHWEKEVEKFINGLFFGATGGVAELYFVKKSALFNATEPLPISNALGVGMKLKLSLALI